VEFVDEFEEIPGTDLMTDFIPDSEPALLATTNVEHVDVVEQDGHTLVISFSISNREIVQPEIIYAVNLIQDDEEGNPITIVDQEVYYDDPIYIGENTTVDRGVVYTAPDYIFGTYRVEIEVRNTEGFPLGAASPNDTISFEDRAVPHVFFTDVMCHLSVLGEDEGVVYTLYEGVDVSPDETLQITCDTESNFNEEVTLIPVFETHHRTMFGIMVGEWRGEGVLFKTGEQTTFTLDVPLVEDPQAYDAMLSFENAEGVRVSPGVAAHYVLRGESATIQQLALNKTSYEKGDVAVLRFYWTGSTDEFAVRQSQENQISKPMLRVAVSDGEGNVCSDNVLHELDEEEQAGQEMIEITILSDICDDPVVAAEIINVEEKVVTQAVRSFVSEMQEDEVFQEEAAPSASYVLYAAVAGCTCFFDYRCGVFNGSTKKGCCWAILCCGCDFGCVHVCGSRIS
jgi:hypothetical protein